MSKVKHYHFIGIGGIGMSALAKILLEQNHQVSGSDSSASPIIDSLKQLGATVNIGHAKENIKEGSCIVFNSMIGKENPEYIRALELDCPIVHRSAVLKEIGGVFKTLAVTGTHGKTTTSSLLATVCSKASLDPAFAIGGILTESGLNGKNGKGSYFVVEADESDGSFLSYPTYGAIVTNIDDDHMDHFKNLNNLKEHFKTFMNQVLNKNFLLWCYDDLHLRSIAKEGISYGFKAGAEALGSNLRQVGFHQFFDLNFRGKEYCNIELNLIGEHQALNAMAVFVMALLLGIEESVIRASLKSFKGVKRRMELLYEGSKVKIFDDYGHHPTEIKRTLHALKKALRDERLIVLFQPHRYTRTHDLLSQFAKAFDEADEVIVTDLYSASEEAILGVDAKSVVEAINESSLTSACFVAKDSLKEHLVHKIRPHDVIISFNAGDLCKISLEVANHFKKEPPKKLKAALFYGGASLEHEISIESARYIRSAFDQEIYEVSEFLVPKVGFSLSKQIIEEIEQSDLIFPLFHGPFGEDGTMQGFFEILGKAYVGCSHTASAIAMDKALTKKIAMIEGVQTAHFKDFSYFKWIEDKERIIEQIESEIPYPVFVKPSHLGSSIGVCKASTREELLVAINKGFLVDTHLIVEEYVKGREIEFAILGGPELLVAAPGEILTDGKVYDYEAKYGQNGMSAIVPTHLEEKLVQEGKRLAKKVFEAIGGFGCARIDFFLKEDGTYLLSEVNPIPGCTSISVFPKAMQHEGISSFELVDRLVKLALLRWRLQAKTIRKDPSKAL